MASPQAVTKRVGFHRDATAEDRSDLDPVEGWLKKRSHRGLWQNRYFKLVNGFLNYYSGADKKKLLASLNLGMCTNAEPVDMYTGEFNIIFEDESTYSLRAPDGSTTSRWCDALEERIEWAKSHTGRGGGAGGGGAKAGGKAGKRRGGDDEEEEAPRGRRGGGRRSGEDEEDEEEGRGRKGGRSRETGRSGGSGRSGGGGGLLGRAAVEDDDEDIPQLPGRGGGGAGGVGAFASRTGGSNSSSGGGGGGGAGAGAGGGASGRRGSNDSMASDTGAAAGRGKGGGGGGGLLGTRDNAGIGSSSGAGTGLGGSGAGGRAAPPADSDDEDGGGGGGGGMLGARGGAAARDRRPPLPPAPPAPSMEGWVKKKALTKFGQWQARYLRLKNGVLYFADNDVTSEYSNSIDVGTIVEVRPAAAAGRVGAGAAGASERKNFVLSTTFEREAQYRATDEEAVARWVATITAAIKHKKEFGNRRAKAGGGGAGAGAGKRRGRVDSDDEDGAPVDSDEDDGAGGGGNQGVIDSDADSDGEGGLPPPPSWFREYTTGKQDEARWMTVTQKMLTRLFAGIYQQPGEESAEGDAAAAGGGGSEGKIVISKLGEATTRACGELEDRVMECRMRGRQDIIKHMIFNFDLKFLQEMGSLTTGTGPESLASKALLQAIDCIEGFTAVRRRALGGIALSPQEGKPNLLLREARRTLIARYMEVMGPKLHSVAEKVLSRLKAEKGGLVRRTLGSRVGTNSPTDLFNLMSEHIKIAKEGGSANLQRRLLSAVMAEVVFYAREVLTELMEWWGRAPDEVDMDYCTAVINDAGLMLDHIEQLEAYFAEALAHESEAADRQLSGKFSATSVSGSGAGGSGAGAEDGAVEAMDREEAEQAKEDLAAVEQDIPRAKDQLLKSGCQLTGVLVDIVTADFKEPLSELFTTAWDKGNHVTVITVTASDYLNESRMLLDPFFFDRLSSMALAHLSEQYLLRLLAPELVRKDKKDKKYDFKGGFGSRFKLTEDRLKKLVADVVEISKCFSQFMAHEDLGLVVQSLNTVREMLTIDVDNLLTVLEVAIKNSPTVSTQIYLAFEKCVQMREDLNKAERRKMCEEGAKVLREAGQPPEDTDDIVAMGGALGAGVMHGASMSQDTAWTPAHVSAAIYTSLFPSAADRAKTLFAGWVPPARPAAASAGPASPAPLSMSSFLGGAPAPAQGTAEGFAPSSSGSARGGAGGGGDPPAVDMGSFLGGGSSSSGGGGAGAGSRSRRRAADDDDDGGAGPSSAAAPTTASSMGRGGGGGGGLGGRGAAAAPVEEDEAAAGPSFTRGGGGGRSGGGGGGGRRRRRGDDDD